jgi:hypothetical protein
VINFEGSLPREVSLNHVEFIPSVRLSGIDGESIFSLTVTHQLTGGCRTDFESQSFSLYSNRLVSIKDDFDASFTLIGDQRKAVRFDFLMEGNFLSIQKRLEPEELSFAEWSKVMGSKVESRALRLIMFSLRSRKAHPAPRSAERGLL